MNSSTPLRYNISNWLQLSECKSNNSVDLYITVKVMPGDNIEMTINLTKDVAMEEGMRFAIREGGRTVGSGVITKIIK